MAVNRYRREGETYVIELRIRELRQLFDLRDPAPFRERDLDPGAVDYIVEAAEETPVRSPLQLEIHIAESGESVIGEATIQDAVRNHFGHMRNVQGMKIKNHLRQGRTATIVGVLVLILCLLGSASIDADSTWKQVLSSGLEIGGWVAIWRPVEHFLYDWWPILRDRRLLDRILRAPVEIHWGAPRSKILEAVSAPA